MFCSGLFPTVFGVVLVFQSFAFAADPSQAGATSGPGPQPDGNYGYRITLYGTSIFSNRCGTPDNLNDSLTDFQAMARAGLEAASYPNQPPYNYFFNYQTVDFVKHVMTRALHFAQDPQDHIGSLNIDCNNSALCGTGQNPQSTRLGATRQFFLNNTRELGHSSWVVSLCPAAEEQLKPNAPPCKSTTPGVPSLGWVMAKQLVQLTTIIEEIYDRVSGPTNCHDLVANLGAGADASTNAENYAYFMQWALDLGYGSGSGNAGRGAQCLEKWVKQPQDVVPASLISSS